ncbi:hypothetical protein CERZMDRAFT_89803 [Cercospora zeae-maydis SCOH1-5]|uniref:Uncharacterized protein n=1 Tax=Cercospora zeae-maydis SCOH1-5 TaxID=717836 RepID=A0A6A6FVD3_9PEZI|nr:hypothetical protein CERZMDRAFT_89803 [Cercospora zeae-maydis SCOH1-5]
MERRCDNVAQVDEVLRVARRRWTTRRNGVLAKKDHMSPRAFGDTCYNLQYPLLHGAALWQRICSTQVLFLDISVQYRAFR